MKSLIKITLNELKRDGITAAMLEQMDEETRSNLMISYAQAATKRFEHFQTLYLASPSARTATCEMVHAII